MSFQHRDRLIYIDRQMVISLVGCSLQLTTFEFSKSILNIDSEVTALVLLLTINDNQLGEGKMSLRTQRNFEWRIEFHIEL